MLLRTTSAAQYSRPPHIHSNSKIWGFNNCADSVVMGHTWTVKQYSIRSSILKGLLRDITATMAKTTGRKLPFGLQQSFSPALLRPTLSTTTTAIPHERKSQFWLVGECMDLSTHTVSVGFSHFLYSGTGDDRSCPAVTQWSSRHIPAHQ